MFIINSVSQGIQSNLDGLIKAFIGKSAAFDN